MKELWLLSLDENWNDAKEKIKDAIEIGFDGVIVKNEYIEKAKRLGRIDVKGESYIFEIKSADDLNAVDLNRDYIFLKFKDWKVIPLENLIAMKKNSKLIAFVENINEAKLVLKTLEKGADGIVVEGDRPKLLEYFSIVKGVEKAVELKKAKVVEIKPLGVGERVCVDTTSLMSVGEGMLVGNRAAFMFLVASESEESEYVSSRPFRVNAGSINAYVKVGDKTKYLAELEAGDEVDVVRYDGNVRKSYVGRVKIERRPLILIKAKVDDEEGTIILQNAETIKLITPNGKHLSVSEIKEGDEVLVWLGKKARHFGMEVDEFIIEK
ncbi:MAG: 3-dehydroquinate synthase II [Archaeoglobaceae archaeon]|nr:3-dehydroquinate synthase II [Archaeoglobaceae archaeon]